jgi:exosortase D (VPLPA-CTERM-specific)
VLGLLLWLFGAPLGAMAEHWSEAEYSHGFLIPPLAVLIAWQCAAHIAPGQIHPSFAGLALLGVGLLLDLGGALSTLYPLQQYAFLLCLTGLSIIVLGVAASRAIAPAFLFLVFMIPLPPFVFIALSAKLQLLSSNIGVALISAASIPVFAEGNVIDLGRYRLQVAEACSGLRYLFPLMSFGYLVGYLYRGPFWQRLALFLSTIPIAIAMNALRIGAIGLTVDRWGTQAAEGFIHLFEGWTVYLLCLGLLFGEAALLWRARGAKLAFADMLRVDGFDPAVLRGFSAPLRASARAPALAAGALMLAATALTASFLTRQSEIIPPHRPYALFPDEIGPWRGQTQPLDPQIVKQLQADDYLHRDYGEPASGARVNLYVVYFASQRQGTGIHSPQNCLPAGGWEIESIGAQSLAEGPVARVNRVVIRKGLERMLVYYWFHQRDRDLTQELAVKWYILADAIGRHRTDGAMIRLITPLAEGEPVSAGDARLGRFAQEIALPLKEFLEN